MTAGTGAAEIRARATDGAVHVLGREELDRVWAHCDTIATSPLQRSAWLRSWLETLGVRHEIAAVAVGDPERPSALAVLAAAPRERTRRLELATVADLFEPVGLLGVDEAALRSLGEALARLSRPVVLRRLDPASPCLEGLRTGVGVCRVRRGEPYPRVPLEGFDDPLARLSSGRRSDIRRLRQRAARLGELTFDHLEPVEDEAGPLFDAFVRVEASSWKLASGTALAVDERRRAFYELHCRRAAAEGILRVGIARIDGRPVAMQLDLETDGRLWGLKTGYDESARRVAPGILLMLEVMRWAADRGLRSFELLGGVGQSSPAWPQEQVELVTASFYPRTARGLLAAGSDAGELLRRRLRR